MAKSLALKKTCRIETGFTEETWGRIVHHCNRLGFTHSTFVQLAATEKVSALDEKEAYLRQLKAPLRGTRAASVPIAESAGMPIEIKTPAKVERRTEEEKLIRNLDDIFLRHCKYVESADGAIDRTLRLQMCHDELREKAKTPEAADIAFLKLKDLLAQRQQVIPQKIMELPEGIPIAGDVDED